MLTWPTTRAEQFVALATVVMLGLAAAGPLGGGITLAALMLCTAVHGTCTRSRRVDQEDVATLVSPELEVERSVRARLYGDPLEVARSSDR
jgi:hypothetical protein